jgi:hypothetical protein
VGRLITRMSSPLSSSASVAALAHAVSEQARTLRTLWLERAVPGRQDTLLCELVERVHAVLLLLGGGDAAATLPYHTANADPAFPVPADEFAVIWSALAREVRPCRP